MGTGRGRAPFLAQPGERSFRVTYELGKEAQLCLSTSESTCTASVPRWRSSTRLARYSPTGTCRTACSPSSAFEAAFGWGWLVELLEDYGFDPHLVHPLQCKAIASARLKNDKVDAAILAQLLRADLLPEAWIAPPEVRQLRALLRHRIHAVLADHGHGRPAGCWTGPGRAWLASLELPAASRQVIDDALAVI